MTTQEILSTLKTGNGLAVVADGDFLHHMGAHPEMDAALIKEGVAKCSFEPAPTGFKSQVFHLDMGRIVGKDNCVTVGPEDDVREEVRPGRERPSRIVYGREAEDTQYLNVILCSLKGVVYIITAFCGTNSPKETNDPHLSDEERAESEAFWACHALIKSW